MGVDWSGRNPKIKAVGKSSSIEVKKRDGETDSARTLRVSSETASKVAARSVFFSPDHRTVLVAPLGSKPKAKWWLLSNRQQVRGAKV